MAPRTNLKKLDSDELWSYALRVLAQRPHSSAELRQKLVRRAADPETLQRTFDKLREYGFANDQKFSESYATSRLQNQGFGRGRVLRDLRNKRVSGNIAEEAINKAFAGTDELDLVKQFLDRRYRGKDLRIHLQDEKNLAGAYRRLRTAGFSSSASLSVLKRFKADLPEWDEAEEE